MRDRYLHACAATDCRRSKKRIPIKPRAVVVAIGVTAPEIELDPHHHRKAQLLFTRRGVLTCEVEEGLWLVPPHCAIWIPGGATHAIKSSGNVEGYTVFIEPALAAELPRNCCTVLVTPLLRELLIRTAVLPLDYVEDGCRRTLGRPVARRDRRGADRAALSADAGRRSAAADCGGDDGRPIRAWHGPILGQTCGLERTNTRATADTRDRFELRTLAPTTDDHDRAALDGRGSLDPTRCDGPGVRECWQLRHHVPQSTRSVACPLHDSQAKPNLVAALRKSHGVSNSVPRRSERQGDTIPQLVYPHRPSATRLPSSANANKSASHLSDRLTC